MKNRRVNIISLFLVMFIITGCSNEIKIENEEIFDTFACYKCIYLAPWSSTGIDSQTEQCLNMYFYEITSDKLSIHDEENNLIESFENIEYIRVDIEKDIDEFLLSFGLEDILDSMQERYDIYINDNRIGYSIFVGIDKIYMAETTYTGGSRDIFTIWSLHELEIQ